MALLAPQSLVDKWYHTDSWVYKNFSFLFKNPLWDNDIPRGFSLCPYFWLSLFSLLLVRPFVYFLLTFKAAVKFLHLGKVLGAIDRFLVVTIFQRNDDTALKDTAAGGFTLLLTILTALVGIGLYFIGIGLTSVFKTYHELGCSSALFLPLILASTFLTCVIYANARKSFAGRCKVEYYVHAMVLICVALAAYFNPVEGLLVLKGFGQILSLTVLGIWEFLKICWHGLGVGTSWLGHGIVWLFSFGIHAVVASWKWVLSLIVGLTTVSLIGYHLSKPTTLDPKKQEETKRRQLEKELLYKKRHDALVAVWNADNQYGMGMDWWDKFFSSHKLPEFEALVRTERSGNSTGFSEATKLAWEKTKAIIEAEKEARLKVEAAERARKEAWDRKCNAVSSKVAAFFKALWWIPSTLLRYPAKGLKWVVVQSATFITLLWKLFWAWKKGACPYMRFVDPSSIPEVPVEKEENLGKLLDELANKSVKAHGKSKMNLTPDDNE